MSQKPADKPTGPAALAAAANKTRRSAPQVRRDRPVPPPPPPAAPAPIPEAHEKAPEIVQEPANRPSEGDGPQATVTTLPTAQQPPAVEQAPVPAQPTPPAVPAVIEQPVPPAAPVVEQTPPAQPPPPAPQQTLSALLRKRAPSPLSDVQRQMYEGAIGKNFKSIANIIRMLSERADEGGAVVAEAVGKGLPEDAVHRLAVTHGIEDWLPFILAVDEQPQQ